MSKNNKNRKKQIHKKSIKHFPCATCITLVMCKSRVENIFDSDHIYLIDVLECSILDEYINLTSHHNIYTQRKARIERKKSDKRIQLVYKYFKTPYTKYPWKDI